jgi:TatD DNase family protein
MILTDTHCHLDLDRFDSDREAVLERARQAGVGFILIPGLNLASSQAVVKLAGSHTSLYAAVGIHPTEATTWTPQTYNELKYLTFFPSAQSTPSDSSSPSPSSGTSGSSGASDTSGTSVSSKILAIGEIGLDYYWDSAPQDVQRNVLSQQLELAAAVSLPVILHMREAGDAPHGACSQDLLQILEQWCSGLRSGRNPLADRPGVLHSFSGSLETAQAAMRLGFYIGITGPVTFKNAARTQAVVAALPLERILLETDAPFLAPHPQRGKRNEPAFVRLTAEKIALLHACSIEQVARITSVNAGRLFSWQAAA